MVMSSLFKSRKSIASKTPSSSPAAPTSPVPEVLPKQESSRRSSVCEDDDKVISTPVNGVESGYASAETSDSELAEVYFTKPHLKFINQQLSKLSPQGE